MKESKTKCEACSLYGEVYDENELVKFEGKKMCPECLARETIVCSHCGERIWSMDNQGTLSMPLCQDCYDDHYTSCVKCGQIIHREDARYEDCSDEPLCYRCYEDCRSHDYIEDYYYKPNPIFYGSGNRFFGVELEVDNGGEVDDNAAAVMRIGNGNGLEHIYCGDILTIDKYGNITKSTFETDNLYGFSLSSYYWRTSIPSCEVTSKKIPKTYQEVDYSQYMVLTSVF